MDHRARSGALDLERVLAFDEYLAAVLFEFSDQLVHQVSVLHIPLGGVEVSGHLGIALVIRLEPRGIEAALVAGQVSGNPGDIYVLYRVNQMFTKPGIDVIIS